MDDWIDVTTSHDSARRLIRAGITPGVPAIPKSGPWPFGTVVTGRGPYRDLLNKHVMVVTDHGGGTFVGLSLHDYSVRDVFQNRYWEPA